ncbi:MAG: (d)CMP kinase [Kiritimatiellaeota bacterium]|nr:(d)CMP kinase [Kiritimatiellota bacterium]
MPNSASSVVAIDGPSASGKSTVSRRVAAELDWCYVDSGALYRGLTWKALREGVDTSRPEAVAALIPRLAWEFAEAQRALRFTIDGEDPGPQLRSEPVREAVSDVAAVPEVRAFIVAELRRLTAFGPLVMEGRDIGSVVFPATPLKFYLDADPLERARRRAQELAQAEGHSDVGRVFDSLARRDRKDAGRKTAPLQIPLGAQVINSTALSIEQVVARIVAAVRGAAAPT